MERRPRALRGLLVNFVTERTAKRRAVLANYP
jgi:hypothetical protein